MKTVLMRKRYYFDEIPEEYMGLRIIIKPFPIFFSNIDILITDSSSLPLLVEDVVQTRRINEKCRVVVMGEGYKEPLIRSLFPFVEFPDEERPLTFESIITGRNTNKGFIEKRLPKTRYEYEVLNGISYGLSQKEMAAKYGRSERSIRRIQNKLVKKTGLENARQLGIYGFLEDWISLSGKSIEEDKSPSSIKESQMMN